MEMEFSDDDSMRVSFPSLRVLQEEVERYFVKIERETAR